MTKKGFLYLMFFVLTLPPCVILGQNQVPVLLNYQQIQYMPDDIEIGVAYAGSCRSLVAQAFNRTAIIDQTFDSPMNFSAVKNTIKIARHSLEQSGNEAMYLRLVAQNGTLTCSNADTPDVFYHFSPLGNTTNQMANEIGEVKIEIPNPISCTPTFVWPKNASTEEDCYCRPIENIIYSFKACVNHCYTNYNVTLQNGVVVFHNLLRNDPFLAHFICTEDPCPPDVSCFMTSFMNTYEIKSTATTQRMQVVLLLLSLLVLTIFGQH